MSRDGITGMLLIYNSQNLLGSAGYHYSSLINYSYLADGTKLEASDPFGGGLAYLGSLVYTKMEGSLVLESIAFNEGRLIQDAGFKLQPRFYIKDHLGSVRVALDQNGQVLERNNYFPFGQRWNDIGLQIIDNRYRYNGKEEQEFLGLPYTDYGARMRNPALPIWNGVDPLAEQTPGISPYAFCNNNPIKHVDPDGLSAQPAGADSMQVVPIAPVTVEAPRLNPAGKALAFIMWGLSGWGELLNDASGNTNTSFSQNMQTGMDFWSSMAVGYGLSKLGTVKTAKVAKNGQKVKLTPERLSHIFEAHGANSKIRGKGKFSPGMNEQKLIQMIETAIENGTSSPNTQGRPGIIYIYDFKKTIGTTNKGTNTSVLKVVVDNNKITTAYPYF